MNILIAALFLVQVQAGAPSCDDPAYRQFDFWIGTWDVYDAEDRKVGRNVITSEEDGCLLVERWTAAGGSTGQSYNFYDPAKAAWRQLWVARGAIIDYEGGIDEEGRMVLEGTLTQRSGDEPRSFRGRWTPLEDGSVQQTFWLKNAETGAWDTWFDANYRRAGS